MASEKQKKSEFFEFRTTPDFRQIMRVVSAQTGKSMTSLIEDFFRSEYEKIDSQKSDGVKAPMSA